MSTLANVSVALVALLHVSIPGCAGVAGVLGARTLNRRILWVQAVPAAMALALALAS